MTEPTATTGGTVPELTPTTVKRLYRMALREAAVSLQTAGDAIDSLLDIRDPHMHAAETGQQFAMLRAANEKAERLSIQALTLVSALKEANMRQTTLTRESLKGADDILKLALNSDDPNMKKLLS